MEDLISGIGLLLDWQVLAALLIGSIGGVIIGAIPGVGAAVAIAILLPATFALPPLSGSPCCSVFMDPACMAVRFQPF